MKKFTFFMTMFIAFAMTAFAQVDTGKAYRIKSKSVGNYLTIGESNANTHGHVHGAALDESNQNQVFNFIAVEDQASTYYVQSESGKYISYEGAGAGWNVNANSDAAMAHALTFEAAADVNEFYISCWNQSKGGTKYFKYENVGASGKYHPFNDADKSAAEVWVLEAVETTTEPTPDPEPEPEPEPANEPVLDLTAAQVGTSYPYQLNDEEAAKVYALSDITIAVKFNTTSLSGRQALFATADPTKVANADAMGTNSYYVAYGMNNADLGYLASWRNGDRYTAGNCIPSNTEGNVAVYVINPTNNNFRSYINGQNIADRNFGTYEIASPAMVKADYPDANIYIGGAMNASGAGEVFNGQITGVKVFNGALSAEEIAAITFDTVEPEPELPALEITGYTPAEAVEKLETITITFNDEIEGTFDMMAMSQIYLGSRSNGCSFAVEGNVLTITPFNAITTPGEYGLVIPEGLITRKANGEKISLNKEIVFEVKAPLAALEITGYTPTEAVEKLETITITFNDEIEGTFDMMAMSQIYLGSRSNGCSFAVEGNVLTITPFNAITTPGEYGLVIPEGLITRKANGEKISLNKEIVFEVKAPLAALEITGYTPTEAVEKLETITITFNDEIEGTFDMMAMSQIYLGSRSNGCSFAVEGNVLTITPFNAITTPGEYGLVIPEGLITRKVNGEKISLNKEIVFTVKEATVEPEPEVIPAANKLYTVVADGHNSGANPQWAVNDEGDKFVSSGNTNISTDEQKQFAFVTFNEATYIYSPAAKKFVLKDASLAAKNGDAVEVVALENGKFFFRFDANHNVNIGGSKQLTIDWWNTVDGGNQFTLVEAGEFDPAEALAALNSVVELVYVYMYNGVEVGRATVKEEIGNAYPAVANVPFGFTANTPEGVVEAAGEVVVECALVENYPIKYAASVEEIDTWYYMQMHSNQKKYIQYLADQTYLEWADAEVAEGEEDSYTWAFVGDPANGFKLVNYAAGKEMAVCSDGSSDPVLGAFADAVVWKPASSKESGNDAYFCLLFPGSNNYMNAQGGKVAYWNDNDAGSTFLLTEREMSLPEVTPLQVVAVTPSEAVESLQTITIEFDAEIAVDEANVRACTIDYGWNVIIGTTANVEGNVLKLVSDTPIQNNGQYPLTIPAGVVTRASDGVAYEGGVFTFEVKEKEKEPLAVVKVTPEAEVEKLDVITIEFNYNMSVNAMSAVVATIANADNSISYTFNTMDDIKYDGKVITFNLGENAITASGEYTLTIPSGLISATDGTKYSGTHTFTVVAPAAPETFAVEAYLFPAPQGEVTKISAIRVEANQGATLSALPTGWTFTNEAGDEFEMKIEWLYDFDQILIMFNPAIETAGTYTLNIPAGSLKTDDGKECEAATFEFTVVVPTGIDGIEAEGEQTIYDLTGRKIETITKGGIYIVNGKKVVIK